MDRAPPAFRRQLPALLPALAGLLLFLLTAIMGYSSLQEVVEATDARKQARMTLMQALEVLSLAKDIETGQRGYIISGDPAYLEPYEDARRQLFARFGELRTSLLKVGGHAAWLTEAERLLTRRLALADNLVATRRDQGLEAARVSLMGGAGKAAMDALRAHVGQLRLDQNARMRNLDARVEELRTKARRLGFLLIGLGGGLQVLAYLLLLREQGRRLRAERALTESAETLARLRGAELASVFEALPDLFFRLSPDGVILDYRARHDDLYIPPEQFLGRRMQDVLPAEVGALFASRLAMQRTRPHLETFEYRLAVPSGERHYEARLNALPGLNDIVVVVRDISNRVEADRALLQARDDLRAFAVRLDHDIESERRRLAREVHDQIGQIFTALKINLLTLPAGASVDTGARASLEGLLDEGIQVARRISAELRPPMLDDLGLGPALEHHAKKLGEKAGFASSVNIDADDRLTPEQSNQLFRIAQEALTNVVRHAAAERVRIEGRREGAAYVLQIEDNGRGLAADAAAGLGQLGMRERAELMGARLELAAAQPHGLRLEVRLPLADTDKT